MIKEVVAKNIRRLRQEFKGKLTQEDLAKNIGVTPNTVSRWETGIYEPSLSQLEKLSEFFGVRYFDLMELEYSTETGNEYQKYIKEIRRTVESRPEWKRGGTKLIAPKKPTKERKP